MFSRAFLVAYNHTRLRDETLTDSLWIPKVLSSYNSYAEIRKWRPDIFVRSFIPKVFTSPLLSRPATPSYPTFPSTMHVDVLRVGFSHFPSSKAGDDDFVTEVSHRRSPLTPVL